MNAIRSRITIVRSQPRLAGYYAVMGVVTALFTGLWLFEGYYLFTAWIPSLYDEITPINGAAAGAFMTLMLCCSLVSLFRPKTGVGASKLLLVGAGLLGLLMPLAFVADTPLVTVVVLVVAATILGLVVRLHPAGSAVLPARERDLDYPLAGLTLLIAVPFLWMAADYQWLQITLSDEVAERWFYGGLSMYLLAIVAFSGLASVDRSVRRLAAGAAVFLGAVLGLISVVYPTELHSFGLLGGGLLVAWCVAVGVVTVRE